MNVAPPAGRLAVSTGPAARQGGLEEDLAAILGIGAEAPASELAPRRRCGLPILAAAVLVTLSSAAVFYLTVKPSAQERASDPAVLAEAPRTPATQPAQEALASVPREEASAPAVAPVPQEPRTTPPAPASPPTRVASAALPTRSPASRPTVAKPAEPVRPPAGDNRPKPADAAVALRDRSVVRPALPASPPVQVETVRPALPEREQLASGEATDTAAAEPQPSGDTRSDRAARRDERRQKERKVLESFDAMRMLRRQ